MQSEFIRFDPKWSEPIISFNSFQPQNCDASSTQLSTRRRRQTVELDETRGDLYDTNREDLKVKVYSGLYVNEASDIDDDNSDDYDHDGDGDDDDDDDDEDDG